MEELAYQIRMAMLNMTPIKKYRLFQKYGSIQAIFEANKEEFLLLEGFDLLDLSEIDISKNQELIQKHIEYILQNNIKVITINDEEYPNSLKQIYDPPLVLFAKGNYTLLTKKKVAIVGSRMADNYGKKISYEMAKDISSNDICVVSGMAIGVDGMAHLGALRRNGNTIAVLGTGLDIIYPKENETLYREILRSGLILSEFIAGTQPNPQNFPMRNRIISGLSEGVLVVEAKEKSGAMITVDFAIEQGKNVYAIPGNIDNILSTGCNLLIREGAKIVIKSEDLLEDFVI